MIISEVGLNLLKQFEGCKLTAYRDIAGVLTIGWGHTGPEVVEGMVWTPAQAQVQLTCDVQKFGDAVTKLVPEGCTQNQFEALTVFAYNVGIGNLRKLLAHPWAEVPDWILKYDKAHVEGVLQPVKGLTRRREAEKALFLSQPASDATS